MTSSNHVYEGLAHILQQFSNEYVQQYQKSHGHFPIVEKDEEWPSPCELMDVESDHSLNDQVFWQPVSINETQSLNFENVESALELTLHQDIKVYFTTIYSESLEAICEEGQLSLLFAWNHADFLRLQENLIGHILMKQRLKQKETIFFAVTDEEDMIVSIDNASGSVWVERVGCEPHKKLADSLSEFISKLTPKVL